MRNNAQKGSLAALLFLGENVNLNKILIIIFICATILTGYKAYAQDTTSPIPFLITYPYDGTEITSTTFAWSASADDVGITGYELYINGELKASVDSSTLYVTLNESFSDGSYKLYVLTKDYSGNKTKTPEITVYANTIAPAIKIYIDNEEIPAGSSIRRMPLVTVAITDVTGIDKNSIKLAIDDKIVAASIQAQDSSSQHPSDCALSYKIETPLSAGTHTIKVEAADQFGSKNISVLGQLEAKEVVTLSGTPINYPNPFKPKHGQSTKIAYSLSNDASITIYIYDINGQMTKRMALSPGGETSPGTGSGGRQGYNEVIWDGKTDYGNIVGNGAYIYFVVSAEKIVGNGQLAVYD